MIEQEDIALVELARVVMHHDAHPEQIFGALEHPHAPVIGLLVKIEVAGHC